jgi:NhaC family Na+:H+ antiporter
MHDPDDALRVEEFSSALHGSFNISPWLLLVPVATGVLIYKRVPAVITLMLAALMAGVAALLAQPDTVAAIGGGDAGATFRGLFITWYGDTAVATGNEALDPLVATRGINGMLSTVFLIFCAAAFGGAMTGAGMIQSITRMLTRRISGRTPLVASTVGTGIFADMVTGDQYLSIILTCNLYKDLFKEKGFESRLLSRSTEDSATVTSVLIPWNSCGMTQATVLKVPTLEYLPYCFFNLISPLMSILIAATGYKIVRTVKGSQASSER